MTIRVVLAEDDALLREGLAQLVRLADGLELVGTAVDLPSALAVIGEQAPDVVVTDIRMPPSQTNEGIQLAARLRREHPAIGVVVLSKYTEPAYALALLEGAYSGAATPPSEGAFYLDLLSYERIIRVVAPGWSGLPGQASGHVIDHCPVNHRPRALGLSLVVADQRSGWPPLVRRATSLAWHPLRCGLPTVK